jgi:WD40 repeat protein/cytoskeletal protein RodZ
VRSRLIENWEAQDEPEHLKTIRDRVMGNELRAGQLLGGYQQVLLSDGIVADGGDDQMTLRLTGLVVRQGETLRVYNAIYVAVFNPVWVERELARLRPYADRLQRWLMTADESALLQGQDLLDHLAWSQGKHLGNDDYRFLAASQDLARREMQRSLEAAGEQLAVVQQEEQQAKQELGKTRQRIRVGTVILGVLGVGAAMAIVGMIGAMDAKTAAIGERDKAVGAKDKAVGERSKAIGEREVAKQAAKEKTQEADRKTQELDAVTKQKETEQKKAQVAQQQAQSAGKQAKISDQLARVANQNRQQAEAQSQQAQTQAKNAQDAQKIAKEGTALERAGLVMQRLPFYQYRASDTLIDALKLGREVKGLLQEGGTPKSVNAFPAVSPLLVLRTAVNSVMQQAEFQGNYARFSADGKFVIAEESYIKNNSTIDDGYAPISRLYDLTGKQLAKFQGGYWSFSADGKKILTQDNTISRLYDLTGKQLAEFQGHSPSFSVDGKYIFTQNGKTSSRMYDLTGKRLTEFQGTYWSFSADGRQVLTQDGSMSRMYDLTGKQLAEFPGSFPWFSFDGKQVFTEDDNTTRMYDLTGRQLVELQGRYYSRSNSPSISSPFIEKRLVSRLYGIADNQLVPDFIGNQLAKFQHRFPIFSADGKKVFLEDGTVIWMYDLAGKQLAKFEGRFSSFITDSKQVLTASALLLENDNGSSLYDLTGNKIADFKGYSTMFSDDEKKIVTWSESSGKGYLYDITGKQLAEFQGGYPIFSKNHKKVLSVNGLSSLLYDSTGNKLAEFQGTYPLFSNDNKQALIVDGNKINLYDLTDKKLRFSSSTQPIYRVGTEPILKVDGTKIRLYTQTGKKLAKFEGDFFKLNPDLQSILISSLNEDVTRLYDLEGNLLAEYLGLIVKFGDRELPLGFTSDSKQILTLTSDGTHHVWDVDAGLTVDGGLSDLITRGCAALKNFRHRKDVRQVCPGQ